MQGISASNFKCFCSFDTEKVFFATLDWGARGRHCMFWVEWIPFRLNAGWWFFCDFPTKPQLCSQTGCTTYLRSQSPPCLVEFRFQPESEKKRSSMGTSCSTSVIVWSHLQKAIGMTALTATLVTLLLTLVGADNSCRWRSEVVRESTICSWFFAAQYLILSLGNNFPSLTFLFLETMLETS